MPRDPLSLWVVSSLVLALRIAPIFVFAPPFSLVRIPRLFAALLGLGLSACLVSAYPTLASLADTSLYGIWLAAVRELMLGVLFVLVFQLTFAALYLAGRTIDIQAGFGLALLIDPRSQSQTPLVGTLFAYAAGAVFFSVDGHLDLIRVLAASLQAVPMGSWSMPGTLDRLMEFMAVVFATAFGVAGAAVLALFLADLVIALLSRTVPQMNVLILGFQTKTIILLLVLPVCFGVGGAVLMRMLAMTLEALPRML